MVKNIEASMRRVMFFLAVLVWAGFSQENAVGIVYGEHHVYSLQAPTGWILDNSSGVQQGLHAVFYPVGGSWGYSPVVMYTNVIIKERENVVSLSDFLKKFTVEYKNRYPGNSAHFVDYFVNTKGDSLTIYKYFDAQRKNTEMVCYIEEEQVVVLIVLVAEKPELAIAQLGPFYQLINSYHFISDNPQQFLKEHQKGQ